MVVDYDKFPLPVYHSIHHTSRRGGVYSKICTKFSCPFPFEVLPKNILLGDHNEKLQKVHHSTSF